MQEYYEFIESDSSDGFAKLGVYAWLGIAISFVETLAVVKFGKGLFPQPWPRKVLRAWGGVVALCAVTFGTWCVRYNYVNPRQRRLDGRSAGAGAGGGRALRSSGAKKLA